MSKRLEQDTGNLIENTFLIQKRISILIATVGIVVVISNIIVMFFARGLSFHEVLSSRSIWLTTISTIPFALFVFASKEYKIIQVMQILIVLTTSIISIIEKYNTIAGPTAWIIFYLLLYKYGFLKKYTKIKSVIVILALFIITERSAYYQTQSFGGFSIIAFIILFMSLLYIIYKSEIDRVIFSERNLKRNIGNLIRDKDLLSNRIESDQLKLKDLEQEIAEYHASLQPFDLDQCKLTPTELKIVRILTVNRATNREISNELGIKESTVKQHFYRIFNKMGVDERYQIIDMCKYNFTESKIK